MDIHNFEKQLRLHYSSEKTIQTYIKQVRPLLSFCKNKLSQEQLDEYLLKRRENITPSSYNLFINAIKKYLQFTDLAFTVPKQRSVKLKEKPYLTLDEFKTKILQYTAQLFNNYEEIDLILLTMFFTGLRPQELCDLEIRNIDFDKNFIRVVNGKGEKDRLIPFIDKEFKNKLKKYISTLSQEHLFHINYKNLEYIFYKIKTELNFKHSVSPYIMRHSFAKHCLKIGIDVLVLQKIMGHTDLKMTQRYATIDDNLLLQIIEKVRNES